MRARWLTASIAIMALLTALPSSASGAPDAQVRNETAGSRSPPPVMPERSLARPVVTPNERRIALCSLAFLNCAGAGRQGMDVCIVGIPRCARGSSEPCCPPACTGRYAALRREGRAQPEAVHAALFPEPGRDCTELR